MFSKKFILPYIALTVSLLLLIAAVVDIFSAITLFQTILFRLAVAAMLLLSFGVTIFACLSAEMRRPLILFACLLQTPIGGGMALVLVYDLCYPDQLQMDALLPILTVLVAFASAIPAAVLLLCKSIEADEGGEGAEYTAAPSADDDLRPIANAPRRKAPPAKTVDREEEDDLSPVSRKRKRYSRTDVPQDGGEGRAEQPVTFTSIDLFSLLGEEEPAEQAANSDIPPAERMESSAQEKSPASDAAVQTSAEGEQSCSSDSTETEPVQSDS